MSAGNIIGGVIGAVIGFMVGGPAGAVQGFMIGSTIGGLLFPPKGPDGPRLSDLRPQSSEYGRPIPKVYGTIAIPGNVGWASEYVEEESEEGGGCGEPSMNAFSYYGNFAVLICVGEKQLGRIWAGPEKRLIYDGNRLEGEDSGAEIRFYGGDEEQLPDPLIESYEGVGNVPAWRGWAYVVFEHFPLANDGNMIPMLTIEVGNVAVDVNEAPPDLGTVGWNQFIVGSSYYFGFYSGTYNGVIIRRKSDNTLVKSFTFDGGEWTSGANFFLDEGRSRMVRWVPSTRQFVVLDWTTGEQTTYTATPPGGADSDLGIYFTGGVYHNGNYVFVAKGSSVAHRVSMFVVSPTSLTCTAAYASNSGSAGEASLARKPSDSSNYVYVVSTSDRKVTKHQIASGGTVTAMGTAALGLSANIVDVDPYTGDLWTGGVSGGVFYATAHTPAGVQALNYSAASNFTQVNDITFTPDDGVIFAGKSLTDDHFTTFNDLTYAVAFENYAGFYPGAQSIQGLEYNDTTDQLMALRSAGWLTFGAPSDPATVNYLIPPTFVPEPDNKYMGEADYNVSVLLGPQPLDEVVADLSEMAGFDPAELNLTALADDLVDGYAIATQTTVREAISALQPVYYFDLIESAGGVKAVKRGGDVVATIPDEDLGAYEDGSQPVEPSEITRAKENDLPRRLSVGYLLAATNYSKATRYAARLTGSSREEASMDFPLVLSDTKAQEVAEVNLYGMWVARLGYRFSLPYEYAYLEPTDVIAVGTKRLLIKKITQSGTIFKVEAASDGADVYTPEVIVTETVPAEEDEQEVYVPADTIMELM